MAERTARARTSRRDPQTRAPRGGLSIARMMPLLIAAGVLLVVGFGLIAVAVKSSGRPTAEAAGASARRGPAQVIASAGSVEVPAVAGGALADAQLVLDAAGFKVSVSYEEQAAGRPGTVLGQDPPAGVLVPVGSPIRLVVAGNNAGTPSPTATTVAARIAAQPKQDVVVIDPGHQAHSDLGREPVGPGSGIRKAKSTGGATGITTRVAEYEVALQISNNLASRLRKAGIKVVMTRTTNDVNLSNAERAMLANRSKADLFVRIHGNASPEPSKAGLSTLYPAANKWGRPYSATSKRAALRVQKGVLSATGAQDNGVEPRGDLAGFNFAKVPSVLVECGFLSNPVEDRLLGSPHYQDKVAQGIADGVLAYLEHTR